MTSTVMRNFLNVLNETQISYSNKILKKSANYIDYSMSGERCKNCEHFINPSRCEIVEGAINANGWCKYFKED
jgi:hypothetical protein